MKLIYDAGYQSFVLGEESSARALAAAFKFTTVREIMEHFDLPLEELQAYDDVTEDTPYSLQFQIGNGFLDLVGMGLLEEPRGVACGYVWGMLRDHEELREPVKKLARLGGAGPGGNVDEVRTATEEDMLALAELLKKYDRRLKFERDREGLLAECFCI